MTNEIKNTETKSAENIENKDDDYTKAIGVCGRWQIMLLVVVVVPVKLLMPWNHFGIIYFAGKTTYRCIGTNSTQDIKNSTCYDDCTKYEYYEETIISEWDLICDKSWLVSFTQTIYMFGILLGSIFFGFVADRYGRRPAMQISSLGKLILCFIIPFCSNYWLFTIIRFLTGFAASGSMMICFVLLMEVVGPSKRELMSCFYGIAMGVGHMVMPAFGYYLRKWNTYALGIAIPHLFFLVYIFYMPESPKWLISVGRLDEACIVMTKAAKMNKLPTENMMDVVEMIAMEAKGKSEIRKKASFIDLIKMSKWRMKILCSCLIWFLASLCFYGANQYIGQTDSNPYLSVALVGLLDGPGIIAANYLSKTVGRHPAMLALCALNCVGSALMALPDDFVNVRTAFGIIGVACTSGIFNIVYLFTSEVFPTVTRNMAMGMSSMTSRMGAMLAPFVAGLDTNILWITPTIFAVVPLIIAALTMCLPETKGKKLEDHLED